MINDARQLVGVPLRRRPHYTEASSEVLLRYSKALGCRNPLFSDLSYGSLNTAWASLLGHPTVIFTFDHTLVAPKLPGIHSIYAGVDIEWHRQIRAGDRLDASAMLTAVDECEGEFCGPMVLQESEVRYTNQSGELVAVARPQVLRTPRMTAKRNGKYSDITRYRYSGDEFDAIISAYESEGVQGSIPLYYEDLAVGDRLPQIVKGPLTTEDMNFFVGEINETLFYKDFVDHFRRHPADVYWHTDTHMPDSWDTSFLIDKVAHEFGFPAAHDTGLQRVAWLECLITNWMGDLAVLRSLQVRLTRPFIHADTAWLRGEVTGLTLEDGRPIANLTVHCENQRGEVTATGAARVELPSKGFEAPQPGLILLDEAGTGTQ